MKTPAPATSIALWLTAILTATGADPLAFPTAEGFGAKATGGRGGEVYHVTTLEDSGPGSFRDAVSKGRRIIIFDVGGYIDLKSNVSVASDLTIAGQSAPGEGIATKNYEVSFSKSHNVIVRYIRFRLGLTPRMEKKYAVGLTEGSNMIFDHVSIQWGRWDCIGLSKSSDITFQNCIIGPGIAPQRFGCLCESDNVTFSHNLWISNQSRNPKSKGAVQYVNNVVYNWGVCGYVGGHSAGDHAADVVQNYFIKGPSSGDHFAGEFKPTDHIFQTGNYIDLNLDGVLNGKLARPEDFGSGENAPTLVSSASLHPPVPVKLDSAEAAYKKIASGAGCSLQRDSVDKTLIDDLLSLGTKGKTISDPAEMGGFGEIRGGPAKIKNAGDGIPEEWKRAHKLNALDANAATGDYNHDGYTNIEKFLNELAGDAVAK
jgi:pectate lyase